MNKFNKILGPLPSQQACCSASMWIRKMAFWAGFSLCCAWLSTGLLAQESNATLSGRVVDQSQALIVGASIIATNVETNVSASTLSNDAGSFIFPPLIPGRYRVSAELPGFKKFVRGGIVLRVQDKVELLITMEVGELTTSVEVTQQLSPIETATATIGQVIDSKLVSDLPLNGRNPYLLARLAVGIHTNTPPQYIDTTPVSATARFVSGGGPSRSGTGDNEFILDGAPAEGGLNFVPSVSAVREFKVQTVTFDAEYGRVAGAVVNVSIKSGTNDFHGEVYEFHRNSVLDANEFFSNRSGIEKPPFRGHIFGVSVGGPVRLPMLYNGKDRTFFFFNYEGIRRGSFSPAFLTRVPTALERAGDFSRSFNSKGELVTIYNPFSVAPAPDGGFTRTAFPDNKIPANRIDPVARKMIEFYPLPNLPGETPLGAANFIKPRTGPDIYDPYIVRVDHKLTSSQQMFVRVETSAFNSNRDPLYGNIAEPIEIIGAPFNRFSRGVAIQDTYTLNPVSVLILRYGYSRLRNQQSVVSEGFDFRTLGLPDSLFQAATLKLFPAIRPDGFGGLGAFGTFVQAVDGHTAAANLVSIRGKHALKFGGEFRAARLNLGNGAFGATSGTFNFDTGFTQGPNPNVRSDKAGHPIASLLLGTPSAGQIDNNAELALQGLYYGLFVQDDIKLTPRLTVNAGLRWEYEAPQTERFNRMSRGFDFNATSPVQPPGLTVKGGLLFTDSSNRFLGEGDKINFAPRVGLAYRLWDKTVVRAGYGIFNGRTFGNYASSAIQPGFSASTTFVSSLDGGITPANFLSNPFPQGLVEPVGAALGLATQVGQALSFVDPHFIQPYIQNFTLNIQQALGNSWLLDLGYVGSRGSHLTLTRNLELNQLPPSFLSQGTALQQRIDNPFFGLIKTGPLSAPTVARQQLLRPYPQFTSLQMLRPNIGNSTYHSFQAKVDSQFSKSFAVLTSYTLSKLIDDVNQSVPIQDNYNLKLERSLSEFDRTHRLVSTVLWELPFGHNKRFLNRLGTVDKLLGGWQVNTMLQLQSGKPLALTATPTTTIFGGGLRPNDSGGPAAIEGRVQDRLNQYFDTSVFSVPPPFNFGNSARTLSDVRDHGLNVVDFSVIKNTLVVEQIKVQFRAEFFNLFNHTTFAGPATSVGTATLGRVTSIFGAPRQIQFALKVIF